MRDPKRIDKFCNQLADIWKKVPDWRFGQLTMNVYGSMDVDPFFPEEEDMIKRIRNFFEKVSSPLSITNGGYHE